MAAYISEASTPVGQKCNLTSRAIKKYGVENFEVETLASCLDEEGLNATEVDIGLQLNSLFPYGYDFVLGNGHAMSEEHKRAIGEAVRRYNENTPGARERLLRIAELGRAAITAEAIERRNATHSVVVKERMDADPTFRASIVSRLVDHPNTKVAWIGRKHKESTKVKQSESAVVRSTAEWRANHSAKVKARYDDPVFRQANKDRQNDPEVALKKSIAQKKAMAKRRFHRLSHKWFVKQSGKLQASPLIGMTPESLE